MARARQDWLQVGPSLPPALELPAALKLPTVIKLPTAIKLQTAFKLLIAMARPAPFALPAGWVFKGALALAASLGLPMVLAEAGAQASPAPVLAQGQPGQGAPLGQGPQPGPALGPSLYDDYMPRKGTSCPLVVPSQVSFLQPKRLKPQEVKAKNAAGCLSPADAIYGADGCPLKLCPNPQWQGL